MGSTRTSSRNSTSDGRDSSSTPSRTLGKGRAKQTAQAQLEAEEAKQAEVEMPEVGRAEAEMAIRLLEKTILSNQYIPIQPTEHQAVFLTAPVLELMYGGAGGGGKSAALLMAALQYVDRPNYHALLMRNSFADLSLPDALIPMSHEWLRGKLCSWSEQKHTWTFPSGATLSFGYMETDADRYRYKSAQFQFVGFDELTQFSRTQYLFLFSRMRRLIGSGIPIRMRSATNPGGPGHEWVKTRFVGRRLPDGTFLPVRHPDRLFIPAKMEDNPYLDINEYRESLKELPELERRQIEAGDWDARPEGLQFKREWFDGKIVDRVPCPVMMAVRFWDFAATTPKMRRGKKSDPDFTAGALMLQGTNRKYYLADMRHFQGSPDKLRRVFKSTTEYDGHDVWAAWEEEGGASGKIVSAHLREQVPGFVTRPIRSTGDKLRRSDPMASAAEHGEIYILRGDWNDRFLDELCSFDGSGQGHDDQVDASVGAFNLITRSKRVWTGKQWAQVFDRTQTNKHILRAARRGNIIELLRAKMTGKYRSPRSALLPDANMN